MIIDVSAFIGHYPYRALPDGSATYLLSEMDRVGIDEALVGHLPAFLYRDPTQGTAQLLAGMESRDRRLHPIPTLHPGLPEWQSDVDEVRELGAKAVRVYPMHQTLPPAGNEMQALVSTAGDAGLVVILTVRFEDLRQRHPLDSVGDLPASAVRSLARVGSQVRLIVTHAGRDFIEEVHFGLTEEEARRVLWDISWVWGPPAHDLNHLVGTVGAERFVFGSGMPLRIPDATVAKLDLSELSERERRLIESENIAGWLT